MTLGQQLIDVLARNHNTLGLGLLLLSACVEYLFPPFPGDMIVVFGAFLVARKGWSGPAVFGAVTLGSIIGFTIDTAIGRRLGRAEQSWTEGRLGKLRGRIDAIVAGFKRHGGLYLAINRFVPSLRGLFFVAAGMARLPWWQVIVYGTASALAWNALLLTLGIVAGQSWERLYRMVTTYGVVAGALVGVMVAVAVGRWWWRR